MKHVENTTHNPAVDKLEKTVEKITVDVKELRDTVHKNKGSESPSKPTNKNDFVNIDEYLEFKEYVRDALKDGGGGGSGAAQRDGGVQGQ